MESLLSIAVVALVSGTLGWLWGGVCQRIRLGGEPQGLGQELARVISHEGKWASILVARSSPAKLRNAQRAVAPFLTALGGTWKPAEKCWTFPNGARLQFLVLGSNADVSRVYGAEFTTISVDPGIACNCYMLSTLRTRLRSSGAVRAKPSYKFFFSTEDVAKALDTPAGQSAVLRALTANRRSLGL